MKTNLDYAQVDRFKEILDKCTKCGFCMSHCPVYREELTESSVARGKIMLVKALLDNELSLTDEMENQLNKCTLCMTCTQNCPAATEVPSIITAARADRTDKKVCHSPTVSSTAGCCREDGCSGIRLK